MLEFARKGYDDLDLFKKYSTRSLTLGLGVIDVKNPTPESIEQIVGRVHLALRVLPPDRLMINPDCGLRHVPADAARAKLRAMSQGDFSGDLLNCPADTDPHACLKKTVPLNIGIPGLSLRAADPSQGPSVQIGWRLHLAFGLSRIVLRLLQPAWADLLASDLDLPTPVRDALVRLDAALLSFVDTDRTLVKVA